ncbi:hypothetical protein L6R53_08905 [Myxococcota bacterium]|nr:hypothetical protein [Myxococcota bacterium]
MALIAGRQLHWLPIGRPAGALLGAVLTVVFGVLGPEPALQAADPRTLALLLGMMLLGGYLDHDGVMPWLEGRLLSRAPTPWAALVGLTLSSALLSALVMNDTVCVLLTPLVVRFCLARGLPLPPYLLALATAANLGSAATLVGNPQNVLVGAMSGVSYARYLSLAGPAVLVALLAHLGLLALLYRRRLPARFAAGAPSTPARPRPLTLAVLLGVCVAFLLGADLAWTGLCAAALLVISHREDPAHIFAKVDWTLLVFFAALFVVMAGVEHQGMLAGPLQALAAHASLTDLPGAATFTLLVVAGSNLLSNVPFVLLFGRELGEAGAGDLGWVLLGFTSTVAGNLTLVGSMANLIVAEAARPHHDLGFWEYTRLGLASTLASLAVGVPVIAWLHG